MAKPDRKQASKAITDNVPRGTLHLKPVADIPSEEATINESTIMTTQDNAVQAATVQDTATVFPSTYNMAVSEKKVIAGKLQFVEVGKVTIYIPTLEEIMLPPVRTKDKDGKDIIEDGLPIYESKVHNWTMAAIFAQVKAQARNKLVSRTVTLKPDATIATNWDTLTLEGERGGNGDALAATREVKALFAVYATKIGKSNKAQETLNTLFKDKNSLALQSDDNRRKMEAYVQGFAEQLNDAELARYAKYLQGIQEACNPSAMADDF